MGPNRFPNYNGTIGAILRFRDQPVILSCYHVLVADNKIISQDKIGQPCGGEVVATLHDRVSVGPLTDVALAVIAPNIPINGSSIEGLPSPTGFATKSDIERFWNDRTPVIKRGIKTGKTRGKISNTGEHIRVKYDKIDQRIELFDQLRIQSENPSIPFSDKMDSGSLILTDSGLIVGLLVGGGFDPKTGQYSSFASPIYHIQHDYPDIALIH